MDFLVCLKNEMFKFLTECFDNIIVCCYNEYDCWSIKFNIEFDKIYNSFFVFLNQNTKIY